MRPRLIMQRWLVLLRHFLDVFVDDSVLCGTALGHFVRLYHLRRCGDVVDTGFPGLAQCQDMMPTAMRMLFMVLDRVHTFLLLCPRS